MGKKIGRNDPCHCGSGKKYKKCHIDTPPVPQEVIDYFQKERAISAQLKEMGIHINYVKPLPFKEKKVWALGSQVYHQRPPNETFHEFIVGILQQTLGETWWNEQLKLPFENMHFIMQSFIAHRNWKIRMKDKAIKIDENTWSATPDGWSRSLISLAFDIASLTHTLQLPTELIMRLKNREEYQGARFEITVAAIIARLNCKIEYLAPSSEKHCEFIATHKGSGIVFAVEAKSRHRRGVLHTSGESQKEEKLLKGDVSRLLKKAISQRPLDKPFFIFIDLNSPLTPNQEMQNKPWFKDIQNELTKLGTPTSDKRDPFNAVFFTNFSYHYQSFKEADPSESLSVISAFPEYPLSSNDFVGWIHRALLHYGRVPNFDTETRF